MATRYAGEYRRSPCPQGTRIKNIQLLTILITGGTCWHPPQDKFSFFAGDDNFFYWGDVPPSSLTSHTGSSTGMHLILLHIIPVTFFVHVYTASVLQDYVCKTPETDNLIFFRGSQ